MSYLLMSSRLRLALTYAVYHTGTLITLTSIIPADVIEVSNDSSPALMLQMLIMYQTLTHSELITTDFTELLHTDTQTYTHTQTHTHTHTSAPLVGRPE